MASIVISGDTSGAVTLQAPSVAGTTTLTLPTTSGTLAVSGGSSSFTNLDYTGTLTGGTGVVNLGSGQFYKDASGNVLIGTTTSNGFKFKVSDGGAAEVGIYPNDTGVNSLVSYNRSTSAYFPFQINALDVRFLTNNGTERMRITSAGNVSIGNSSPAGWTSPFTALSMNTQGTVMATSGSMQLGQNIYYDGAYKFIGTGYAMRYYQNTSSHTFTVSSASGSAGGAVTENTVLNINQAGNLTLLGGTATASVGIAFPATQSASSDGNTLDDYEEGTFTPSIAGTSTPGTVTWTTDSPYGRYTKVGNVCTFQIWISWSNWTGPTGSSAVVTGLPFTSASGTSNYTAVTVYMDTAYTLGANNLLQGYINQPTTNIFLSQYPVGGGNATGIGFDTNAGLMISGTYRTS